MRPAIVRRLLALGFLLLAGGGAYFLWKYSQPAALPPGIAFGNGRLEATEVDVATKIAGRLSAVHVREGDDIARDQVVAALDADDLKAQLRATEA